MKGWIEKGERLNELLRPQTFPLAIKLIKSETEIPEKATRPLRDLKVKVALCQGITMSRRYGWTVGMTAEDLGCSIALAAYGWKKPNDEMAMAKFLLKMGYAASIEAGVNIAKEVNRFEEGEYVGIVFSPLAWTKIVPDLIMMYGNPAQIMRLIHASTHHQGNNVTCSFSGRAASCTEGIIQTVLTGEPKAVIPGNGDRVWAMTQDDEMAFTIPATKLGSIIEALEVTHERGIRYPIPICQRFQPEVKLGIPLDEIF
ncbi:MAG: hypothetical protein MOIL_00926 [Candidatus Methanolliviera sp. GoM_oil]|nr:MAG: hypothetical protein MOIL_00926 [Candidatus Methanolliviera sp. GoM_oil]